MVETRREAENNNNNDNNNNNASVFKPKRNMGRSTRALKTDLHDPDFRSSCSLAWGSTQHALNNHAGFGSRIQLARVEVRSGSKNRHECFKTETKQEENRPECFKTEVKQEKKKTTTTTTTQVF